jgi:hypothetical protein
MHEHTVYLLYLLPLGRSIPSVTDKTCICPKHRDAPEPTGEEGEDADMELPKVYEPVPDWNDLRDRLEMFLLQFNEMVRGAGMDLVFFPDAMLHIVKVRINTLFFMVHTTIMFLSSFNYCTYLTVWSSFFNSIFIKIWGY